MPARARGGARLPTPWAPPTSGITPCCGGQGVERGEGEEGVSETKQFDHEQLQTRPRCAVNLLAHCLRPSLLDLC